MWKIGNEIVVHNQLLFFAAHGIEGSRIEVEDLYQFVGKHSSHNSDGIPLSEWRVTVEEVEEFLEVTKSWPIA
jgi:hypothetical protein